MSTPTATAAPAPSAGLDFLRASRGVPQEMALISPNSNAYAASTEYRFESVAGDEGLAEAALIMLTLPITPTIATGNKLAFSPYRSFFPRVTVSKGGQVYQDTHPIQFRYERLLARRNAWLNRVSGTIGEGITLGQWAAANLPPSSLPALTTATAVTVTFYLHIPLRWLSALPWVGSPAAGMFPVGDTSEPLRITVFSPTALVGDDPMQNPILEHPGATDSVAINANSTVKAMLWYRQPLVYAPGAAPKIPVVGIQLIRVRNDIAIASVGGDIVIPHRNEYPHLGHFVLYQDGNADANATTLPGTALGLGNYGQIARYRERLTSTDPITDLDTADKINAWVTGWRQQVGQDLPDGVFPYWPYLGLDNPDGWYVDPDFEIGQQIPSYKQWKNAATILNLASGTTLGSTARATELSTYLTSVTF